MSYAIMVIMTALLAYSGYRKGWQSVIARLFGLAAAYAGALLLTGPVVTLLLAQGIDYGVLGYIAIGLGLFISCYLLIFFSIRALAYQLHETDGAIPGAILNGLFGAALGLLLVWGAIQVWAPLPKQQNPFEQFAARSVGGLFANIVGVYFERADETTNSEPEPSPSAAQQTSQQLAKALISQPGKAVQQVRAVNESGLLQHAFQDQAMQLLMEQGKVKQLTRSETIQELAKHEAMIDLMQDSGLIDADTSHNEVAETLSLTMTEVWQRTAGVQHSPEFQAIVNDPDFQTLLKSKNPLRIMASDHFNRLTSLIMSGEHTSGFIAGIRSEANRAPSPVYKWRDSNGEIHYTDTSPPQGAELLSTSP